MYGFNCLITLPGWRFPQVVLYKDLPKKGYKAKACFRSQEESNSEMAVLVKETPPSLLHEGGTWPARRAKGQIGFLLPKTYLEMLCITKEEIKYNVEL